MNQIMDVVGAFPKTIVPQIKTDMYPTCEIRKETK